MRPKLIQCPCLNLTNPFSGHPHHVTDLFQRVLDAVVHTVTQLNHLSFTGGQIFQDPLYLFFQNVP